jgi:hypothetical protein
MSVLDIAATILDRSSAAPQTSMRVSWPLAQRMEADTKPRHRADEKK